MSRSGPVDLRCGLCDRIVLKDVRREQRIHVGLWIECRDCVDCQTNGEPITPAPAVPQGVPGEEKPR